MLADATANLIIVKEAGWRLAWNSCMAAYLKLVSIYDAQLIWFSN